MTLASWFSSMRRTQSRLTRTRARRNRSRAFNRGASFEALENRRLLATVNFTSAGETLDESADTFLIPLTLSDNINTVGFDWPGPVGLACDSAGNLYVNQSNDAGTVSKVTPQGNISTFAKGFQPLDERAGDLAFGPNGNLYVANPGANAVDEVTPQQKISPFVSGLNNADGLAFDRAGNLYVSDPNDNRVSKVTPQGHISTFASGLDHPTGLAFGPDGNLYVANELGHTVIQLDSGGNVVGGGTIIDLADPVALAFDWAGALWVADAGVGYVDEITTDGLDNAVLTGLTDPDGLAFDSAGNLYVAQYGGSGALGAVSEFSAPVSLPFALGGTAVNGVAYEGVTQSPLTIGVGYTTAFITGTLLSDPGFTQTLTFTLGTPVAGSAVVASPSEYTLTITEPPIVQFFAGSETVDEAAGTFSIPVTLLGTGSEDVSVPFTFASTAASGTAFSGVTDSPLTFPAGQTTENITGNLVSDPGPSQTLTFLLDAPLGYYGALGSPDVNTLTIDEPAAVQFSAGSETVNESAGTFSIPVTVSGALSGSVFATGSGVNDPYGLAADAAGNVYVADAADGLVSEVTPGGKVSTFASGFNLPWGMAVDAGVLYVADGRAGTVSKVPNAGATPIPVVSGLQDPTGLAFDSAGNLYISSNNGGTVIEVPKGGGPFKTIASGLDGPSGLAFDAAGNLYIADTGDGTVSMVAKGGGAPSPFAFGLGSPWGLAIDSAGNLFVANQDNDTVEVVSPAGVVSTFASGFDLPTALTLVAGRLYVADNWDSTVSQVPEDLVVPLALGGTAQSGVAYSGVKGALTFAVGQTTQDITGTLLSDPGPTQTLTITLRTPAEGAVVTSPSENTLTINEPPGVQFSAGSETVNESAGKFSIPVTLSGAASAQVTVPYTLVGTAASGIAYSGVTSGVLAFGIGQTTQNITGTLLSDPGANQTLTFTLGTPAGGAALGSPSVNTLTITERPAVQFKAGSETVNEAAGTFSIPVTLSGAASAQVTVPYTLGGTAASGIAYSGVTSGVLTFGTGQTTEDVTGTLLSDPGPDQTLTFTLGKPTGGAALGSPSVNTLTITERQTVQFKAGSETVNEAAGTFSIPVTLSGAASAQVTVPYRLGGTAAPGIAYERRHVRFADVWHRADHRGHHRHAPLRSWPQPDADIHPGHAHWRRGPGQSVRQYAHARRAPDGAVQGRQRDRERERRHVQNPRDDLGHAQGRRARDRAVHARRHRGRGHRVQRRHGRCADVRDRADHRGYYRHAPLRSWLQPEAHIHPGHAHRRRDPG